jgi:hypothetical protein
MTHSTTHLWFLWFLLASFGFFWFLSLLSINSSSALRYAHCKQSLLTQRQQHRTLSCHPNLLPAAPPIGPNFVIDKLLACLQAASKTAHSLAIVNAIDAPALLPSRSPAIKSCSFHHEVLPSFL